MNEFRFYDTSSLLLMADNFSDDQYYIISSISLNELEGIKSSNTIDEDIKYAARRVLSYIDNSNGNVEVIIYNISDFLPFGSSFIYNGRVIPFKESRI